MKVVKRKRAQSDGLIQLHQSYVVAHWQSVTVLLVDGDRLDVKDLLLFVVYSLVELSNHRPHTAEKLSGREERVL